MNQAEWNKRILQIDADLASGSISEEEADMARTSLYEDLKKFKKRKSSTDLHQMAARIAGTYDFKTKMKINAIVLEELARASGMEDYNVIAELTSDSEMHKAIQGLADAIQAEADRLKEHPKKTAARLFR